MFDGDMPYEGKIKGQILLSSWAIRAGLAEEQARAEEREDEKQ